MQNAQSTDHFFQFKSHLKAVFGEDIYESYFHRMDLAEESIESVTFVTPTRYAANVIKSRFAPKLQLEWSSRVNPQVQNLKIVAAPEAGLATGQRTAMREKLQTMAGKSPVGSISTRTSASTRRESSGVAPAADVTRPGFQRGMRFDRFCTNDTNRLARHAAMKLIDSDEPAVTMIHGAAGRGKTHLLNAVAQEWLARRPDDNVLYLTYDELMNDVSEAFVSKSIKELRTFLQTTDVLLVDDIQMLRGRKRTQEELDCLIDRLRNAGKRVMVAGSLPPKELMETGISPRLANRLAGGLCVTVEKPDLDLRLRVARQFADEAAAASGVRMPERHVDLVARRCEESVRDLEGALSLIQVATEAEAQRGELLTDDRARRLLDDQLKTQRPAITPEGIFSYCCDLFEHSRDDLAGRSRKQEIVRARHAFCFATRRLTDTPLKGIGAFINRDHTTVMHSIRTAEILAGSDPKFGARISRIFEEFPRS